MGSNDRTYDVVLLGATGFVGRYTASHLARSAPAGVRIALAARSEDRLQKLRRELGVDWRDLFVGPLETSLPAAAVVTSASFPALPPRSGTAFAEVARRKGDYAVCGAGVVVTLDEDRRVAAVRASYVSVDLTPEVRDLTDAVAGSPVEKADWAAAGALARTLVDPDGDLHASADYRRLLVGVLTERTLAEAAAEAAERTP